MEKRNKCLTFYVTYNELMIFGECVAKSKKNKTNLLLETFGITHNFEGLPTNWKHELITATDSWWNVRRYPIAIYLTPKEKALLIECLKLADGSNVREKVFARLGLKLDNVGKKTDCSIYFGKGAREGRN